MVIITELYSIENQENKCLPTELNSSIRAKDSFIFAVFFVEVGLEISYLKQPAIYSFDALILFVL